MGKATKKSLPTEAELFMCLREDIQKLSKAVQDFVTQVTSNHVDVFDNPNDDEYDLDLAYNKEYEEFFSEQNIGPSYGVFDEADIRGGQYSFDNQHGDPIFDVYDVDVKDNGSFFDIQSVVSNLDKFDERVMEQVTTEKVEVESLKFNYPVYVQETPTLSPENFVPIYEVIRDFNINDTSLPFQTMMETGGRSDNYFWESSRSNNREDHMDGRTSELIHIHKQRAGNTFLDLQQKHMNYGAWRKNFNRHISREPPDRVQYQGCEAEKEDTAMLTEKITKLEEALIFEQEKNRTLEHELSETRRNIRMLNKGSTTLDKIQRMGRTEKTTAGLGYQGGPSGSHTVFVRSNSVETDKPDAVLESAKNRAMELHTVPNVYTRYFEISLSQHQGCVRQLWSMGIMRLFQPQDEKNWDEEDHYEKWVRIFPSFIESAADLIQRRGRRDMQCKFNKAQVILMDMPIVFQAMAYISVTTLAFAMNYAFFFMANESKPSQSKYSILKILSYNIMVVDILLMETKIHGAVAILKQVKMLDTGWYDTFQRWDISCVPAGDHDEILVHNGTTSELLVLFYTTDLSMAQSGNSTEVLDLPQFSDLSILWCFTWDELSGQKSLCRHHLQCGLIIQDVNFNVSEMLEQTGTVFSHQEHCPMPKHVDFSKLAKHLLVNDDMLECTLPCVSFLTYSEIFWYTRIDVDSHTATGRGNIYRFKFEGRCMVLFLESELPILPLLFGVIGSRQMTKDSCTSSMVLWCAQYTIQNICPSEEIAFSLRFDILPFLVLSPCLMQGMQREVLVVQLVKFSKHELSAVVLLKWVDLQCKGHLKRILMKYLVEAELRPVHKNIIICVVMIVPNSSHEYDQVDTFGKDTLKHVMISSLGFVWELLLKHGAVFSSSFCELESSYGEYIGQHELRFVFHVNAIKGVVMCLIAPPSDIFSSLVIGGWCLVHPRRERALYAIAVQEKRFHDKRRTEFLNWWPLGIDKMGSNYRSTTLICWNNVSCASGKPLCFILVNDIIFLHGYTSLRSRTSVMNEFLDHLNRPMYHVLDSVGPKCGIQSLPHMTKNILLDINKVNWLNKADTCSQRKHTMHWMLTEENKIKRNLKREKIKKDVFFLEVRHQQFPFLFEVESLEPGGT
ncbi:hypothetical protein IGI04_017258 [Brassica rapa subsp. trilocularis]|uniref:DUF1985 domain-containing protein n=1 Tax=Brassica rapa subsp. trilocularis TaxID=1813537 RepID=A0ABQ7MCY2_BRACM|nr:hypothetical protein IGI04_017258 [Brassica rapa subsp. trilocularis]